MINRQEIFSQYMNEFDKLSSDIKSSELIEKQNTIISFLSKYVNELGYEYKLLDSLVTDNDSLNTLMVNTQNIEELIGIIVNS